MLAAVKRSKSIRVILTIPEIRPASLTLMRGIFNLLLVIHYVTASPKSATIHCTPKISKIDLCHPSPNRSAIICIPNFAPNVSVSLLRFLLSPLDTRDLCCTFFFRLSLPFAFRVG